MSRSNRHRAERQFGLTVGGLVFALACWWLFRGRFERLAPAALAAGALLLLSGAFVPRILYWPNRGWMALAEGLSFVSTRVVLGIVFFLAVTPIGMVKRSTGGDPLRRRSASAPSYWTDYRARVCDPRHYEKMY